MFPSRKNQDYQVHCPYRGMDFRFRPLTRMPFEKESGYCVVWPNSDELGNKLFTQNTLHIQQAVIPGRYLERHGHLSSKSVNQNISDHDFEMFQMTPPPYWRAERTPEKEQTVSGTGIGPGRTCRRLFHRGFKGGTIYDGGAFPGIILRRLFFTGM